MGRRRDEDGWRASKQVHNKKKKTRILANKETHMNETRQIENNKSKLRQGVRKKNTKYSKYIK